MLQNALKLFSAKVVIKKKFYSMTETKTCQNCKNDFVIDQADFGYYEKIKVPPPTFCPDCRLIRRLLWRNEKSLYKRPCLTKEGEKQLLANYHPDVKIPIYEESYWWGDSWDPMDYGQDYDFSRPFFEQLKELLQKVPQPHATNVQITNSDYCNFTYQSKSCYLAFASDMNEDSAYLHRTMKCKNSFDMEGCENMESCIMGYRSKGCYQCSYTYFSYNCIDSNLMWDCHNCQSCYGCFGLRNKSNCIFNVQYSKEEYKEKIKEFQNGSHATLQENLKKFFAETVKIPHKFADILQSQNVTGDYIHNAKNCFLCFDVANKVEDCKFTSYAFSNMSQCYDVYAGGVNYELSYETTASGENAQSLLMCAMTWTSSNMYYSIFCNKTSNSFGCVGMRDTSYCILNKQYTKEQYEDMLPKIIQHMKDMPYTDEQGRVYGFGEFFPMDLSPFAYNETPAQDFYPKTKEEAIKAGYKWREKDKSSYTVTLNNEDLPDNIADVPETITSEVIECEAKDSQYSPGAFRIIPTELALYKKLSVPLQRKSPNVRYYEQLVHNNPFHLWHRYCMCTNTSHGHTETCPNEFETAFSPERPERIYCESCYQKEMI